MPQTVHQAVAAALRRTRLLSLADKVQYYRLKRFSRAARERFVDRHGPQALPPDDLAYDAYGFLNWEQYWQSGLETAQYLRGNLCAYLPDRRQRSVLEWGCGPGRIVRHLSGLLKSNGEWTVSACDANAASIAWCRAHIAGVAFDTNALAPPLPFAAAAFDAVYGISVLTHLSVASQRIWTREIARVLKDGGIFIVSLHGEGARPYLLPSERTRYDRGEPVERGNVAEGRRTFVAYHPPEFVRDLLGDFAILRCETSPVPSLGVHDLYVARRRPRSV